VDSSGEPISGDPAQCANHRDVRFGELIPYLRTDNRYGTPNQASMSYPTQAPGGSLLYMKTFDFTHNSQFSNDASFNNYDLEPVLDAKTRSVRARVQVENPDSILKPNVFVNVEIKVALGEQTLIPETAVLDSGARKIAFVERVQGVFEPRLLKLGPKLEDHYTVIAGVTAGERVVDQATFFVDSESKLKAAIGQMQGHQH